jgi:hypothetical protein
MSNLSTLPKGDSAWLLRKAIERIMQQVSVLETNIGSSTTGNSANTQIIFNDNGTLRGDAGLVYNKTTDALTVAGLVTAGSATITGDLTVRTNKLIVNANGVGAGKTPLYPLDVGGNISMTGAGTGGRFIALLDETNTYAGSLNLQAGGGSAAYGGAIAMYGHSHATYPGSVWIGRSAGATGPIMFGGQGASPGDLWMQLTTGGVCTWLDGAGGTRMTLNSTGLGIGDSPSYKIHAVSSVADIALFQRSGAGGASRILISNGNNTAWGLRNAVNDFIFSYEGTDLVTFGSSGNVGVGVTPTNLAGHKRVEIKGDIANLTLRTISSNVNARDWQVACNLDTFGELNFRQGASQGAEPNSGTTRMVLTAAGDVSVSTGNVVMATSGKGIDFSATASGSGTMTSELLNDYEEGTFTPTIIGTSTAGVGVYTVQDAKYTKVGRLVTVEVDLGWSAHTGTGNMQITGLPFTTNATVFTSVTLGYVDNIALTAGNIMTAYTSKSSTLINLNQTPTGGGATTGVPIDVAGRIMVSVTYSV